LKSTRNASLLTKIFYFLIKKNHVFSVLRIAKLIHPILNSRSEINSFKSPSFLRCFATRTKEIHSPRVLNTRTTIIENQRKIRISNIAKKFAALGKSLNALELQIFSKGSKVILLNFYCFFIFRLF